MNAKILVLKFASSYHMQGASVAGYDIPVSNVRAIYNAREGLIVETIDGKHMRVTSSEIQIGEASNG